MAAIDIVVPLYNEAAGLRRFHGQLLSETGKLGRSWRVLYVNDGSTDGTQEILDELCRSSPHVAGLELSRNFGHQAALAAGLDHSDADAVIMMDGDGQHPPELIHEMIKLHDTGYEIVQMQRVDSEESAGPLKRLTARGFYWLMNRVGEVRISEGGSDFRLVSRTVCQAVRSIREYHRFWRGIVPWVGFRSVIVPYQPARRGAGASKYSLRKMLRLAADGLFSFSLLPLRIGLVLGALLGLLASFEIVYIAVLHLPAFRHRLVPGWSSLILLVTISSSVLMILIGIIGIYVGMIFQEVKRRPVYIVRSSLPGPK